jgi:hypothetical protein
MYFLTVVTRFENNGLFGPQQQGEMIFKKGKRSLWKAPTHCWYCLAVRGHGMRYVIHFFGALLFIRRLIVAVSCRIAF